MTLDLQSRAELEALFAELSQQPPIPNLIGPIDAQGFGQIAAPLPVFLHFDEDTGRLALFGGPMAAVFSSFSASHILIIDWRGTPSRRASLSRE
jgi:hypothetical protein